MTYNFVKRTEKEWSRPLPGRETPEGPRARQDALDRIAAALERIAKALEDGKDGNN